MGPHTQQRSVVLKTLVGADGIASAQAFHGQLAPDGALVGLSTAYRTLTALAGGGLGRPGPRHGR